MHAYYSSTTGLVHLIAAAVALLAGTATLAMGKGTRRHRLIGYVYWISMVVMLTTSFMTYRLFGGWGIFHYLGVVSTATLLGGIVPVFWRKGPKWVEAHFAFMYWSVFGLYAAFVSELLTRVPDKPFFSMVGLATFATMGFGYLGWYRYQSRWKERFVGRTVAPRQPLFPRSGTDGLGDLGEL